MRVERLLLTGYLLLGSASILCSPTTAWAILFDFNALNANVISLTGPDLIETYMEQIYGYDITVNVGAKTRKDRIEGRPSGLYLGNSDKGVYHSGPKDTFLINRWNSTSLPSNVRDRIVVTFSKPISSLELDYEIFPVTQNGQSADFTLWADSTQLFFTELLGAQKPLGKLGHVGPYYFPTGVTTVQFVDWNDAPIGIDNLSVTPVPEPASLFLLGSGLAGLAAWRRTRRDVLN